MQPVPAGLTLEAKLEPELQIAGIKGSASLSESRVADAVVVLVFRTGQFEIGVIQDVEAFRAELELYSLGNLDVLEERGVPLRETRPGEGVTAKGSGISRRRPLEYATDVVVAELAAPAVGPHIVRGPAEGRNRRVGAIIGFEIVVVVTTAPRAMTERLPVRACVIGNRAIELPAAQDGFRSPTAVFEEWKLVNIVHGKRVADIKDRIATVEPWQSLVAAVPFTRAFMVRTGSTAVPRGTVVNRVAPRVMNSEL